LTSFPFERSGGVDMIKKKKKKKCGGDWGCCCFFLGTVLEELEEKKLSELESFIELSGGELGVKSKVFFL
jgi:hypothetical protein